MSWMDKHLVPDWRDALGMASVRLAGVIAAVVTTLASQPDLLLSIIAFMPTDPLTRAFMAIGVGLIAFFGPTGLRLWKQGGGDGETGEN